jgi:hypothetical protein
MGARLAVLGLCLLLGPLCARADVDGFDAGIDLRAISSNGERSFLNGGLGSLRYDAHHEGVRLGAVWVDYNGSIDNVFHFVVDAIGYGDGNRYPLDLTQAFVEWRPFPLGLWRSRAKVGAFYAPISLENWLSGWRSPYTLSFSAINTWVGEELRTIGAEYDLDWLGRQRGYPWQLGLTASGYRWNEPAGTLIARRGWALDDRQTTLFGRVGTPGAVPVPGVREFWGQFGGSPGYYIGLNAKYRGSLELRALHYDNLADYDAYSTSFHAYAWSTYFDSAGVAWTPTAHWTVISQWLAGNTCVLPQPACYQFSAGFLLGSWQLSANRVSARYDDFQMHSQSGPFPNSNRGHAWTLSYQRDLNSHLSVVLEELVVDSSLVARLHIGEPERLSENELQFAVRAEL